MHRLGFFLLLVFAQLSYADQSKPLTESEACGKEIELIDKQVQKLEQEKQFYQDEARKYQKLGDNWQYSTGNIQDGYANWNRADQQRRRAIQIQEQIDLLLQRRSLIIQFYPELYQP